MKHIPISLDDEDYKKLLAICRALKLKMVQAIRKLIQEKDIQNFNKIIFVVALCLAASSCGGAVAQTQPQSTFVGRYLFRSELHTVSSTPFVEAGVIGFDGNGRLTTFTTYNDGTFGNITSPNLAIQGSYTFGANGIGTITMDFPLGSFGGTPYFFCTSSRDYCTIESTEPGRSWQGKIWLDKSTTTISMLTGSYIFESDGNLNQFSESGIIAFSDQSGHYNLSSIYNVSLHPESSNLQSPTPSFTCGVITHMNWFGQPSVFEATQGQCPSTAGMDAFAVYCFLDGSFCLLAPDQTGAGWIAEMRKQ